MEIFAQRLKELRKNAGLTQKELADALKMGQASICDYENAKHEVTISAILAIAEYFNVSTDYLLGKTDWE